MTATCFDVVSDEKLYLLQIAEYINPDALIDLDVELDIDFLESFSCEYLHVLAEALEMEGTFSVRAMMEELSRRNVLESHHESCNLTRDVELCVVKQ